MQNALYLLPPIIAAAISLFLLLIVLLYRPKEKDHWLLSLILASITVWAALILAMRSSTGVVEALFWDRWVVISVFAVPLLYYHFSLVITKRNGIRGLLPAGYLILIVITAISHTDLLVESMEIQSYGYAPIVGRVMLPVAAFAFFLHATAIYILSRAYLACREYEQKNRLLYIIIAIIFPLFGAVFELFPSVYPTSIFSNIIFGCFATIAIVRYHLLDIRVLIRKSLVYLLVSAAVAIPYVVILLLLSHALGTTANTWWVYALILLLLAVLLRPMYDWAQRPVDKLFYRDRYNYLQALERFSQNAQSILDLSVLGSEMVNLISGALKIKGVCLLMHNDEADGFVVTHCSDLNSEPGSMVIGSESPIAKWLQNKGEFLSVNQFDLTTQLQSVPLKERQKLEALETVMLVPIRSSQESLTGIITLGKKLSQQFYSQEDKRLLFAFSNQMSMALENARLYDQVKRSERVSRESEEKLRLMYESMAEGVIVTDLNGQITQVNDSTVRMHSGETKEYLIGRNISELVDTANRKELEKTMQGALKSKKSKSVDLMLLTGNAEKFPGKLNINPLRDTGGDSAGFVIVSEDVTERREAEEREKQLQAELNLSSRLASIGEMAAGIAHEINNPLTGVIGFSTLLMKKDIPKTIRKYVNTIYDAAQRVSNITSKMLAYAHQTNKELCSTDINDILETTLEMQNYDMKANNITVTTRLDPDLPTIVTDAGQIQQVFLNIILNAKIEMVESHGMGNLLVKTERTDNTIRVSFQDDGSGISKENVERIFEPFFTTRGVGKGVGLGLSVCYGIITQLGGKIRAESEAGQGATFIVELPLDTETALPEPDEPAEEKTKGAPAKVLVVDDDTIIQQFLTEMLREGEHEVDIMDNGGGVLERLGHENYDVILLDIKLPGMSGIQIYEQLQEESEALTDRIIFITGDTVAEDTADFLTKTKALYVTKPFDVEKLKDMIHSILTDPDRDTAS